MKGAPGLQRSKKQRKLRETAKRTGFINSD